MNPRTSGNFGAVFAAAALGLTVVGGCASSPGSGGIVGRGATGEVTWTILALEVAPGEGSQREAERIAGRLRRTPGINGKLVQVTHDPDGVSRIYYGSYPARTDPRTGRRLFPAKMDADLRMIRFLREEDGSNFFAMATRARKPMPDVGNPAWALSRAEGPYTLQVAVFEAHVVDEYKEAASKWCEELRQRGYEAFYHHATVSSMVTVGQFSEQDVRLSAGKLIYGERVRRLQEDELLRYNYINGAKVYVIDDGRRVPVPSQLMIVPGREDAQIGRDAEFSPTRAAAPGSAGT